MKNRFKIIAILLLFLSSNYLVGNQDDRIIFNHSFHVEDVELSCEECHDGVESTEYISWNSFPYMDMCLTCHDGDTADEDCEKCHTNPEDALSFSDYWKRSSTNFSHQLHTNFINNCSTCHDYVYTNDGTEPNKIWNLSDCNQCHSKHEYVNELTSCSACHTDFHMGNNGLECQTCHNTKSWEIINSVEIHQFTRFPLIGAHRNANCEECHISYPNVDFPPLDVACYSCHSVDYMNTQTPNHLINNISQDCEECHSITSHSWDLNFNEHSFFPLTGGHISLTCMECHTDNNFQNISSDCYSCHQTDYNATSDPNHVNLNFSKDCEECHSTNPGWSPSIFNHSSVYVLSGGHDLVKTDCTKCHADGFINTPTNCSNCHIVDYNLTIDPNHVTNQFPQNCTTCHTTNPGWYPTIFNHSSIYPLTGGHSIIQNDCSQCHANGYSNTSTECVSCHLVDYNNTIDPNHLANQFPQDCELCHDTGPGWTPSNFNHDADYFPIYSGDHRNKWDNCNTCHINPANYTDFSCFNCHKHNQNSMNQKHSEVNGYIYNSYACYDCYPNGDD